MDTKKIKRPVLPATLLFLTSVMVIAINVFNLFESIGRMIAYWKSDAPIAENLEMVIATLGSFDVIIFPLAYLLTFVLCLMLFIKKKNGLLVASVGIYTVVPVGIVILNVVRTISSSIAQISSIAQMGDFIGYEEILFFAISLSCSVLYVIGLGLWSLAAIALLVISLSAWDKIFEKPKTKKIQSVLKKFFWLPAVIYLLAIPLLWASPAKGVLNILNAFNFEMLIYSILFVVLPNVIIDLFTLGFFLTFGLWLRNPYKKGMESAENNEAINDTETEPAENNEAINNTETESAEKSANEEAASAE